MPDDGDYGYWSAAQYWQQTNCGARPLPRLRLEHRLELGAQG